MEYLLHYTWKHRLFPFGDMVTTHGEKVEVMSVGMHNSDGGPDFIGARLKIGGVEWAGNVEIHMRSSDWYRHHHDTDAAYDTVVLHVVGEADREVYTHSGVCLPQLVLRVPDEVNENYERLNHADSHPRCQAVLRLLPRVSITSWLSSLCVERLHSRVDQLDVRRGQLGQSWEDVAFVTVARNFGFGKNGDAFERWAMALSTSAMNKHRDDLFQVEALFFGTAGLLAAEADASMPDYYRRLQAEWKYLSRKFGLKPIDATAWQFLRMRPQNFPYTRIAQLAMLYHDGCLGMSRIMGAQNVEAISGKPTTHSHLSPCAGAAVSCQMPRNDSSSSIAWFHCCLPMADTGRTPLWSTVPSRCSTSCRQNQTTSHASGSRQELNVVRLPTRKPFTNSPPDIAKPKTACTAVSAMNICVRTRGF